MHKQSYDLMSDFVKKYLSIDENLNILDVGSGDVNGTYKPLFNNPKWTYTGLDIEAGKNVDIVINDTYKWDIKDETYDVVISGQCLEHVEDIYAWVKEINRVLKPDGIVCIIAPWAIFEHRYPIDCWRILPDGMRFLLKKIANLQVIETYKIGTLELGDCVGIAIKSI